MKVGVHIATCPKHPMRDREEVIVKLQARIEELERSLAGDEAKRIVASWPEWKRNIGHGLEPKPQEEAPQ